jgi:hypothetical protein
MNGHDAGFTTIARGRDFELLSSADGASFVLRSRPDHYVAHLQGDDADKFRADYLTVKSQFPDWEADRTLAQLWDQGGYSWLATQEGE